MGPADRDILGVLSRTDLLSGLSPSQLEKIAQLAAVGKLGSGEAVFPALQRGSAIYVLAVGMASIEMPISRTMYVVVQLSGPFKALGWSCLRPQGTYAVSARALMNSAAIALPLSEFTVSVAGDPDIAAAVYFNMTTLMNQRLEALALHIAPEAPMQEWVEQYPLLEGRQFAWRGTPENVQAHCIGETCTAAEGKDCPLVGRSPLEWHKVAPRLSGHPGGGA